MGRPRILQTAIVLQPHAHHRRPCTGTTPTCPGRQQLCSHCTSPPGPATAASVFKRCGPPRRPGHRGPCSACAGQRRGHASSRIWGCCCHRLGCTHLQRCASTGGLSPLLTPSEWAALFVLGTVCGRRREGCACPVLTLCHSLCAGQLITMNCVFACRPQCKRHSQRQP